MRSTDHFFVLNDRVALPEDMSGRTCFIRHAERNLLVFVNLWEAWRILRRERPTLILGPGAGPAVPFALLGRILGIPSVFIESAANVTTPSLTGRMMYLLAKRVFYQWPSLAQHYPRGIHGGPLLWSS